MGRKIERENKSIKRMKERQGRNRMKKKKQKEERKFNNRPFSKMDATNSY